MLSAGDDSMYLDDEFYESARPTSAKALPSITVPFSGTLASIQERSSLEDIKYFIFLCYSCLNGSNVLNTNLVDAVCLLHTNLSRSSTIDVYLYNFMFVLYKFISVPPLSSTRLSTVGDRAFPIALLVSGTVYPSTSLLHLHCLSSSHASRLISSPFPIPVPHPIQSRSCSDTCHFGQFNHLCYLLT